MPEIVTKDQEFSFKNLFVPLTTVKAINWLILIGLCVFSNGLFNGFVGDDTSQIVDNTLIHSLYNWQSFFSGSTFFNGNGTQLIGIYYKPLLPLYYAVVYAFAGPNALLFHAVQIVLVISNACLLCVFLKRFFALRYAFVLSVIFLLHPLNSEVAFYIADVQEALYFFFGICALLLVADAKSVRRIFSAGILLFLSLLSKESGILFLVVSALYIVLFNRTVIYKFFVITGVMFFFYCLLRFRAVGFFPNSIPNAPIKALSFVERLQNMPAIFFYYIKTFFFPLTLSSSYQWVYTRLTISDFVYPLVCDLIVLLGVVLFGMYLFKHIKQKHREFLLFIFFTIWFATGMLLVLQVYPLDATVSDGWFYFPVVGLLGMIGVFMKDRKVKLTSGWAVLAVVCISILFCARVYTRSFDYRNDLTLAAHDLRVSDSFSLDSLVSNEYNSEGKYTLGLEYAKRSVKLFPYMTNYNNLGSAYVGLGNYPKAYQSFSQALRYGDYYITYENFAVTALAYGNRDRNIRFLQNTAIPKFPDDATLWLSLAILTYENGNKELARLAIQYAYALSPSQTEISVYQTIESNLPMKTAVF